MSYSECKKVIKDYFNLNLTVCDKIDKLCTFNRTKFEKTDAVCLEKFNNLVNKAHNSNDQTVNDLKQIDNIVKEFPEIMQLEAESKELDDKYNNLMRESAEIEKLRISDEELLQMDSLKLKIRLYKQLMGVHFTDKEPLSGYVKNKSNLELITFNDGEDIGATFWNRLETVTGIDCKQIVDDLFNI